MDHLPQLHKNKHGHSQSITQFPRERACSIPAVELLVHTNNSMVKILLSGSHGGQLIMCTFRTRGRTVAESLWRKAWNVSHGQMRAVLKGISIASRQTRPYVMVTSLRDTFPNWCPTPCQHTPSWKSTGLHRTSLHSWKRTSFTFDKQDCLLQQPSHECFKSKGHILMILLTILNRNKGVAGYVLSFLLTSLKSNLVNFNWN